MPARPNKPNIVFIMGDDIGWFNIGAYHRGMMAGRTPNLDRLAEQGTLLTDYYAESSCAAGRASFVTGQLPIRTGLTAIAQVSSKIGMPEQAPTIATVLKQLGYTTGQFGKYHLGDRNEHLPTRHGFDEFWGCLQRVDGPLEPVCPTMPREVRVKLGPRNLIHSVATNVDDPSEEPRWGHVGRQAIEDLGPLFPKRTASLDDEILAHMFEFIDRASCSGKPFFVYYNPTRMRTLAQLSQKYQNLRTPENGWGVYEVGMAQLDDLVGAVMNKLEDIGLANDTILVFTTDKGAENFAWPAASQTPFAGTSGTLLDGGFRVPCIARWPGHVPANRVENGLMSGLDWFPTLTSIAGNPYITEDLRHGKLINGKFYRAHLDGYDQSHFITGRGPSQRHEILYFVEASLGAVRIDDYKYRFVEETRCGPGAIDFPIVTNLRMDPFERTGVGQAFEFEHWYEFVFWRFVLVQEVVGRFLESLGEFPPIRLPASFNLEAIRAQVARGWDAHVSA